MPVKKKKSREYRTGSIETWEARQHFDKYYKTNTKSRIGAFRGKIFDMLYQKSSLTRKDTNFNATIKCNMTKSSKSINNSRGEKETLAPGRCEKGSIKYLLPKGPKTFDIEGIDSFTEGTKFTVPGDSKNILRTSKGYSLVKKIDKITKVVDKGTKLNKKDKKIYGPRSTRDGELYSSKFRKAYKARQGRFKEAKGTKTDEVLFPSDTTSQLINLVDARWNKYKRGKKTTKKSGKKRKIKRKVPIRPSPSILIHTGFANTEDMIEFTEDDDTKTLSGRTYTFIKKLKWKLEHNKIPIDLDSDEFHNMNDFIRALKLKVRGKIIPNIMSVKYLKIKLEKIEEDIDSGVGPDEEVEYIFILHVGLGHLLDIKKPNKKLFKNLIEFYKSKEADYKITDSSPVEI